MCLKCKNLVFKPVVLESKLESVNQYSFLLCSVVVFKVGYYFLKLNFSKKIFNKKNYKNKNNVNRKRKIVQLRKKTNL